MVTRRVHVKTTTYFLVDGRASGVFFLQIPHFLQEQIRKMTEVKIADLCDQL